MSGRSSRSTLMLTNRAFISRGGVRVLEGFVRHDVAPVAGGVADREQDGLVRRPRLGQRRLAPGPPVHRVVGVLEQVGRGGEAEQVRRLGRGGSGRGRRGHAAVSVAGQAPSISSVTGTLPRVAWE